MAREKARSRAGSAWDREFLGQNTYGPSTPIPRRATVPARGAFGDAEAFRVKADQSADPQTAQDIIEALLGNDRPLMPYQPTATINPGRPRTLAAGYDERTMTMRVKFRDGEVYSYYQVPPSVWFQFSRAQSPGRYINTKLNNYPYQRGLV
jgi:hypothetical protein